MKWTRTAVAPAVLLGERRQDWLVYRLLEAVSSRIGSGGFMLAIVTSQTMVPPPRPGGPAGEPVPPPFIPDSELSKIAKLVPTEVVGLYVTALGFSAEVEPRWFMSIAFAICIPLTVFLLRYDASGKPVVVPVWQYVFRILSFVAWALAISQPFGEELGPLRVASALLVLVLPIIGSRLIR